MQAPIARRFAPPNVCSALAPPGACSQANDFLIARKYPNQQLTVSSASGYRGRLSFAGEVSGNVTFTIWSITKNDEGTFEFEVSFISVNNPWIRNSFELIVVGKLYVINNLSKQNHIFGIIVEDV